MAQNDHRDRVVDPVHPFLESRSRACALLVSIGHIIMADPVNIVGRAAILIQPFADCFGNAVHALYDPCAFIMNVQIMRGPDDRNTLIVQFREYFPDKFQDLPGIIFGLEVTPVSDHIADQAHIFHVFRHSFHRVPDAAFRVVIIRGKSKMVLFFRRRSGSIRSGCCFSSGGGRFSSGGGRFSSGGGRFGGGSCFN